jgi:hypothetical protein
MITQTVTLIDRKQNVENILDLEHPLLSLNQGVSYNNRQYEI